MSNNQNKKKKPIKTYIKGLDNLLNGGFRLNYDENKGLLVVIRGERGISKINIAMQMMKGIAKSLRKLDFKFYSLNKDKEEVKFLYQTITRQELKKDNVFPEENLEKGERTSYLSSKLVVFNHIIKNLDNTMNKSLKSCIVIDGFAGLATEELNRLPLDTLEEKLRRTATIGILIFDDRLTNQSTNADVIIEMRRNYNKQHDYTFFELQISKGVSQHAANGWHKYKCLDYEKVEVYPSVHKVLSDIKPLRPQYTQLFYGEQNYKPEDLALNNYDPKNLENLLCPKSGKITSIVGASNTFKRYLTAISISKALKNKKRCLVVLFNENKQGFINILNSVDNNALSNINLQFLELPVGCISPAEVINIIQEYIYHFTKDCCDTNVALFMLDLIALDYSFPILVNETLFLPALAAICKNSKNKSHTPNVSLYLLCTKSFSLVNTVTSISDNVICTERNVPDDFNKLTIYLEKNSFGVEFNSRIFKYDIDNIHQLHYADLDKVIYRLSEIHSTKEFWRKAINVKNIVKVNND